MPPRERLPSAPEPGARDGCDRASDGRDGARDGRDGPTIDVRGRAQPVRGRDAVDDRPVAIDDQIDAMTGEALAARLRRAPLARLRRPPGPQGAAEPILPLGLGEFHDLRRLGLFGDDGRNPPPSWWAR